MNFLKMTAGIADDVLTLASWMINKMEAPGVLHNRDDVMGLEAEVSVAISPGRTGEIIVVQGGRLHHYPAQGADANNEYKRGAKVRVKDVGAGIVFVGDCDSQHPQTDLAPDEST